jgi:hypothetical protein
LVFGFVVRHIVQFLQYEDFEHHHIIKRGPTARAFGFFLECFR